MSNFKQKFIRGLISTGTGNFLQIIFGFLGVLIAVRLVSEKEFGIFVLIQVVVSLFVILMGMFLNDLAITRFIACSDKNEKIKIVSTVISIKVSITTGMCVIIYLFQNLIFSIIKTKELHQIFLFIPLIFFVQSFDEFFQKILQGFHEYKKMAISQILHGFVKLLLIVTFLAIFKLKLIGLLYALLFSYLLSSLYQFFSLPVRKRIIFNMAIYRKVLKFGFPLGLNNVLSFVFEKVDRFMIGAMMNPINVAYYEVAAKMPVSFLRLHQSFQSVFFPNMSELFSQKYFQKAERLVNNSLRFISFLVISFAFVIALFQRSIVRFLFSERYIESASALSLLMICLSCIVVQHVLGSTLVALGHSDKPAKINIVNCILNVAGNFALIPVWGFMGAVYASILAHCVTVVLYFYFMSKTNIRIKKSNYFKPLIIYVFLLYSFHIFSLYSIVLKLVLSGAFVGICYLAKVFSKKDFILLLEGTKLAKPKTN